MQNLKELIAIHLGRPQLSFFLLKSSFLESSSLLGHFSTELSFLMVFFSIKSKMNATWLDDCH